MMSINNNISNLVNIPGNEENLVMYYEYLMDLNKRNTTFA